MYTIIDILCWKLIDYFPQMFYGNDDELVVVDGLPFQIQVIDQFFAGTPFVMYQLQSDQ